VGHRLGLATKIQITVYISPFPSTGTAVRSVTIPCENGSLETTVTKEGQNPVPGLSGHTPGDS